MKHKHYEFIVAWAEGKDIQVYRRDDDWINDSSPSWHFSEQYRIKPESVACPRCGKVHTCEPDKIAKKQAKEIADAVDRAVLNQIDQRQYYMREAEYCREEIEAFNSDPSEKNRSKVLAKRRHFLESGGSDRTR